MARKESGDQTMNKPPNTAVGFVARLTTIPKARAGELSVVEELGPRGTRNALLASSTFLGLLGVAFIWVIRRFQAKGQFAAELWVPFKQWQIWRFLFIGLANTLKAAGLAFVLAFAIGMLMALWRTGSPKTSRIIGGTWIEIFRSCALVLLIKFAFFQVPKLGGPFAGWPLFYYGFTAVVLGLTLYYSAVFAEVIRSGLRSIPKGQSEAALSIGLTSGKAQRMILLPQALKRALPNIISQAATLLKDTSLGAFVTYGELLGQAKIVGEFGSNQFQTFIVAGAIYIATIAIFVNIGNRIVRRSDRSTRAQK
jgi:glutamate transport system permease protein